MEQMQGRQVIEAGRAALGIEFGSTRIKAVLIGPDRAPMAQGDHEWENRLENGLWTYSEQDIRGGLQSAYRALAEDVKQKYGVPLRRLEGAGISAMMHGYLPFDAQGRLLVPFRTWRNSNTAQASDALTKAFAFHIPQRWSIAHLYQAMLNGEAHVPEIAFFTTLAGYVHWQLTGEKVLGTGDAAGMFPLDADARRYDPVMLEKFAALTAEHPLPRPLTELLPGILPAGACAGRLTAAGAALLDPSGELQPGVPFCPPEGDAGTGMVATDSVAPRTGNVSAGTSIFAMIVLEKPLRAYYPEVDVVTTPAGRAVAMVHCNNCTSDLNAWMHLFREVSGALGGTTDSGELYGRLFRAALAADADAGGLMACNYLSGEHITGFAEGRPLVARTPGAALTLANFMRASLYSAMATLRVGMDILTENEHVAVDRLTGHGGLFKTAGVMQPLMASALGIPVTCRATAGEGGPWGMALLAAYMAEKAPGETLEQFLSQKVFAGAAGETAAPDARDAAGFARFLARWRRGLDIERAAVQALDEP